MGPKAPGLNHIVRLYSVNQSPRANEDARDTGRDTDKGQTLWGQSSILYNAILSTQLPGTPLYINLAFLGVPQRFAHASVCTEYTINSSGLEARAEHSLCGHAQCQ